MCLMKSGAQWQKEEETRKDINIVPILRDKKFFTFELFKVIQDAIPLSFTTGQCIVSEQFLRVNLELDLTKPRLASYSKSGKCNKTRCTGSIYSLLNEKD